nr:reverse transcriptase domain-containing protein [Tanacetum cinerariifolium]
PEAEDADNELEVEEAGVEPEAEGADVELEAGSLMSEENVTLGKKLAEKEVLLDLTGMERDRAVKRLSESIWWNKGFYLEMVRKGAVPKPPSDDEGSERPRKTSKKSDGDEGPSDPQGSLMIMPPKPMSEARMREIILEQYIRGLTKSIRGDVTSSQPATINDAVRLAYQLTGQLIQDKADEATDGEKRKGEGDRGGRGDNRREHDRRQNQRRGGNNHGGVYQLGTVNAQEDPKVVTSTFLLNNHYATVLFDSGADRSFVSTKFSTLINIKPVEIDTSYEVELADGKIVSTNNVLKGCTRNLLNHSFLIDLMVIELGNFDVIIGMDWLSKNDAAILCGEKKVRITLKNKALIIEGDRNQSRLKIISCIKAQKYIDNGCELFLAHVTGTVSKEK